MSVQRFKDKPFCSKFDVPADDILTTDKLLNELNRIRKGFSRETHEYNNNINSSDWNQCIEVPRGNISPNAICLTTSISEIVLDDSSKLFESSKVIKFL